MDKVAKINRICEELRELSAGGGAEKVSLMVETGEDETIALGTLEGYVRFAG